MNDLWLIAAIVVTAAYAMSVFVVLRIAIKYRAVAYESYAQMMEDLHQMDMISVQSRNILIVIASICFAFGTICMVLMAALIPGVNMALAFREIGYEKITSEIRET